MTLCSAFGPRHYSFDSQSGPKQARSDENAERDTFINAIVNEMTVEELTMQFHLMFADNIVGPKSDNGLYDFATRFAPTAGVGVIHDWYPTSPAFYNTLQELNLEKSRLPVPFMQTGECLHGVGSFKQSMFPQSIGLSASWDTSLVHQVGRAIGSEARAIGIHACFAPVLDLAKDVRWGRVQEAWGEDFVLTSHMGVAYASGLSKNGSWSDTDAVVPVMKHFAGHGSPSGGLNAAPYNGAGTRQYLMEFFRPFKAVVDLGGARGVLMAYHEFDGIPSVVNSMFYEALEEWGFDGFVIADDASLDELQFGHMVSSSPADTLTQWFNAGGMIQYYDFDIGTFLNVTADIVSNGSVPLSTLQSHVRRILTVKYDLGLFANSTSKVSSKPDSTSLFVPSSVVYQNLTVQHAPLTLEAARASIVLLENRNSTLPIKPDIHRRIALIGPFGDILNFGDYSGNWGASPAQNATTIRQALLDHIQNSSLNVELVTSSGSNTWYYNGQYGIPRYLLSPTSNGTRVSSPQQHGLLGTYFADTNFSDARFTQVEAPNMDWGLYPPLGLPSNNFSVIWEGILTVPVEDQVNGSIGVAVSPNTTARLFIDGELVVESPLTTSGNILGNIESLSFDMNNGTMIPPGGAQWTFRKGATHQIRIEYQTWNLFQKLANVNSVNSQVEFWWNLVDPDAITKAVDVAKTADLIILAVGANWNSDGENGDRATLGLSDNQTALADALFDLDIPVVLVLQGGRPFAIPEYYARSAAVLETFFSGQSGGQAISDVLFGEFNPGGRMPFGIPFSAASLPDFYNFHPTARDVNYTDIFSYPSYWFGYGLSYTNFSVTAFNATSSGGVNTFTAGETITFRTTVTNEGSIPGSYVTQVYLLGRVSSIVRPSRQLVAFTRTYLNAGESKVVTMDLEVDRYLPIVNRQNIWELETGDYTFALLDYGGPAVSTALNVTMTCLSK
ncbi:glycoside hydrolase family 3 protein [Collybiopsis luxurians FD-317 M1]|uniref:xylan 1,4-beta-xylosidase n=1 Tax=Collybiopsis luxurians FD-317 M1 TaxID=944289 RepID=A0A0D0CVF6_9AGAR|nr:glycoside hydrolase family 3 protein [Collybiopsis luxurians FD-317 M1]